MKTITYPHDKVFKALMKQVRVAEAFLKAHLPIDILTAVDLSTLTLCDESFLSERLHLSMVDILYQVKLVNEPGFGYLLIEHQTSPYRWMAFRLLKYLVLILERYLKNNPHKRLSLVHLMVFYTGKKPYPYSLNLYDLFLKPHGLVRKMLFLRTQLIDLSQVADFSGEGNLWLDVLHFAMKHIHASDTLHHTERLVELLKPLQQHDADNYIEAILTYWFSAGVVNCYLKLI